MKVLKQYKIEQMKNPDFRKEYEALEVKSKYINYKKLGQFIRQVDVRNTNLSVDRLLGVSVQKKFIPSIANTVGTDFSKYKIVERGQFTYIPNYDEGLVSNIYTVFEIIDKTKLIPEYLMLWFSRSEFDRYARYKSHGSVREIFDWNEMCNVELPVPPIEKQLEIVHQYKVISDRIALKQKINNKLDLIANAIYKKMFIGFKKYKKTLGDIADISAGGDKPNNYSLIKTSDCCIPIYSNGIENEGLYGFTDKAKIFKESITISARGTIGYTCLRQKPYCPIVRLISIIPKDNQLIDSNYLYFFFRNFIIPSNGTSQQQLTVPDCSKFEIEIPEKDIMINFSRIVEPMVKIISLNKKEIDIFKNLQIL